MPVSEGWPGHKMAQTLIVEAAREEFEGTGWQVYEEYEYASAGPAAHPLQEEVREVLEEEFRTSNARPKPDITMISDDGAYVKVAEIGTQRSEKQTQLHDRIVWWRHCLQIRGLDTIVQPLDWRPPRGIIGSVYARSICTEPTWRESAPAGVILYEVHDERASRQPVPIPVPVRARGTADIDFSKEPALVHRYAQIRAEVLTRGVPALLVSAVVALACLLVLAEVELVVAVGMAVTAIVVKGQRLDEAKRDLRLT